MKKKILKGNRIFHLKGKHNFERRKRKATEEGNILSRTILGPFSGKMRKGLVLGLFCPDPDDFHKEPHFY